MLKDNLKTFLNTFDSNTRIDLKTFFPKSIDNKPVLIYGAGNYGSYIYKLLKSMGLDVVAFLDQKATLMSTFYNLPVFKAEDDRLFEDWKKEGYVIVALVKPFQEREAVFNFLKSQGFLNIIDAQSLRCHQVDFSDPVFDINVYLKENTKKILDCYNSFSDKISQVIYSSCIKSHFTRDYSVCFENKELVQYFPSDITFYKGYARFIDCGSYTGDTLKDLLKRKKVQAIAAFEPDINVFDKLCKTILPFKEKLQNVFLFPCALSDKNELSYITYDSGSSSLTDKITENQFICSTIDDTLTGFAPTFIKMDIEGAELKALKGASNTIHKYKPDLAISVYHNIDHYWEILLFLEKLVPSYSFYLRTHNSFTMETILYATTGER